MECHQEQQIISLEQDSNHFKIKYVYFNVSYFCYKQLLNNNY